MTILWIATIGLALLIPAGAQTIDFNFDALAAKAKEKAEITLDGPLLALALEKAKDNEKINDAKANVSRLTLRHYEFKNTGEYSDADLEPIRKQVSSGSGWSRILSSKEEHESVEIFMLNQGGKPGGFLLIAAEEKELTVVHVVGSIELATLQEVVNSTIAYDLSTAGAREALR